MLRSLLILAGFAMSFAASAQEIYRWVDKDGIVHYADQPGSDKAELVNVIEPNAYEAADAAPPARASRKPDEPDDRASSYGAISITSPEQDQTFFGADAVVTAQVDMRGTLEGGDQLVFFLNGERRPASGDSLQLSGLDRGSYFLRASILDPDGKPLVTSPQIQFHVRQPSINSPQSPQAPRPPKPAPKPTPKPGTR
jgi:hypothetical protein